MRTTRWLLAAGLGLALVAAGVGVGVAMNAADRGGETDDAEYESGENEGQDSDETLGGADAERAAAAALEHTGGGDVLEVEAGDDGAAYGVEVRQSDGSVVEVHLDEDFAVIGEEADED